MLKADHFFTGGVGHHICEDYALSGSFENESGKYNYGIVCDGCTQSPDTDIGARILTISAKQVISSIYRVPDKDIACFSSAIRLGDSIIHRSYNTILSLELNVAAMDATLLMAVQREGDSRVFTFAFGDGFVFGIKDGEVIIKRISYNKEAPYYLRYQLMTSFENQYKKAFGDEKKIENWGFSLGSPAPENQGPSIDSVSATLPFTHVFDDFDVVGIASDGFDQIRIVNESGNRMPLTYEEVMRDALNIKNFTGEFVRRHLSFLIKRKWKDRELFDDISVAMIANIE